MKYFSRELHQSTGYLSQNCLAKGSAVSIAWFVSISVAPRIRFNQLTIVYKTEILT